MLTGKCKEDFVEWFHNSEDGVMVFESLNTGDFQPYQQFIHLPISMQYGVYVDFFDSVDLEVVCFKFDNQFNWFIDGYEVKNYTPTRTEALQEAISKANEIYNEK